MSLSIVILVLLLLILGNGLLAMSEIAVVSARRARLQERARSGDGGARAALRLQESPGRFLSTVQVGITLIGVLAGAFGGVALAEDVAPAIARVPGLAAHAEGVAIGLVVFLVSYVSVLVGELVPKQIALKRPEVLASRSARALLVLSSIASPVVWLLDRSSRMLLRLFRFQPTPEPPVTEEELRHLLRAGRRAGVFEPAEQEIAERVLRLGDRSVGDLVVPRVDLVFLDAADPPEVLLRKAAESDQSLYPVIEGAPENVLGLVTARELLLHHRSGIDRRALEPPVVLPETLGVLPALERFRRDRIPGALVFDEHAGLEGMITLRSFMEALVGGLPTVSEVAPLVVERSDGSLLVDGVLATGELAARLELAPALRRELERSRTLGGFVLEVLGRVPTEGDAFDWGGWRFDVVDMDRRRVDKVLLAPLSTDRPRAGWDHG